MPRHLLALWSLQISVAIVVLFAGVFCRAQDKAADEKARRERQAKLFGDSAEEKARRERQEKLFGDEKPNPVTGGNTVLPSWNSIVGSGETKDRWAVFVIPGTYANDGTWFHVLAGQATFSSELQTALGTKAVVHPFIWRSSIHHEVREKAAANLAVQIQEQTQPTDRIVLVAHSHGGNVALLAASQCKRKIDTVVCLSTPNVYYIMAQKDVGDRNPNYMLPVYCPPAARRNIERIVTITPRTDRVPDIYADLRKGVDENDALHATRQWRDEMKTLSLRDDNSPFRELLDDVFDTKSVNHVVVSSHLNVAHHNIVYPSIVPDDRGHGAHEAVHSRRMGAVIGILIKNGFDDQSRRYLQTLTQFSGTDSGDPIPMADQRRWENQRTREFQHSGWVLVEAVVTSSSTWDRDNHLVPSDPDPYFRIVTDDDKSNLTYQSSIAKNLKSARWTNTSCVVGREGSVQIQVFESNPNTDQFLGAARLSIGPQGPPTKVESKNWSAILNWRYVHE